MVSASGEGVDKAREEGEQEAEKKEVTDRKGWKEGSYKGTGSEAE